MLPHINITTFARRQDRCMNSDAQKINHTTAIRGDYKQKHNRRQHKVCLARAFRRPPSASSQITLSRARACSITLRRPYDPAIASLTPRVDKGLCLGKWSLCILLLKPGSKNPSLKLRDKLTIAGALNVPDLGSLLWCFISSVFSSSFYLEWWGGWSRGGNSTFHPHMKGSYSRLFPGTW